MIRVGCLPADAMRSRCLIDKPTYREHQCRVQVCIAAIFKLRRKPAQNVSMNAHGSGRRNQPAVIVIRYGCWRSHWLPPNSLCPDRGSRDLRWLHFSSVRMKYDDLHGSLDASGCSCKSHSKSFCRFCRGIKPLCMSASGPSGCRWSHPALQRFAGGKSTTLIPSPKSG